MGTIISDIKDDIQKLEELRRKIGEVKRELESIDIRIEVDRKNSLERELKSINTEYAAVARNVSQAEGQILTAQKTVDGFTSKIIEQKNVVREVEHDVKRLGEAYRTALKNDRYGSAGKSELAEYNAERKVLEEERTALFNLTQEKAKATLHVKQLRDEYRAYRDSAKGAESASLDMGKALGSLRKLTGISVAGLGVKELVSDIIKVRGEFQQADTAIQTMLGSKEKADKLLSQVREYAKISPLEFGDITRATQMMLGFNIEVEKVPGFIKAIGDVSMGESGRFNSLTLAFSQMSATGKLMGQDLNQMINAGFNPLSVMAEKTGKSIGQLKEEMSKGLITTEMVQQAFVDATSAGGKFFGMSENASKTINGQISMMHDAMDAALNDIGKKSEGIIITGYQGVTKLIENYETVGRVLLGLSAAYGTYRTALAVATFAENGHTLAMTMARAQILLTQKAQALLNATMLANPYVLAAAALGTLAGILIATSDTLSAAEHAQKSFNDEIERDENIIKNDREEIEKHISVIRDETETQGKRRDAYDALIALYPTLASKYKNETELVNDLTGAYRILNAEIAKKEGLQAQQRYDESKQRATELKRYAELRRSGNTNTSEYRELEKKYYNAVLANTNTGTHFTFDSSLANLAETADKKYRLEIGANRDRQLTDLRNRYRNMQKEEAANAKKRLQDAIRSAKAKGKNSISINGSEAISLDQGKELIDILNTNIKTVRKTGKEWQETLKDTARKNKKAGKELLDSDEKITEEQYQKRLKEAKEKGYDPEKEAKAGDAARKKAEADARKQAEARKKTAELFDRQKREQARKSEDIQLSTREAEIKAMSDGTEKAVRQIELDRDREIAAIRRSYEDLKIARIEEARKFWEADTKNSGKNFFESDAYRAKDWDNSYTDEEKANYEARKSAAVVTAENRIKAERQAERQQLLDYIKEYGDIQAQKAAITEEYDRRIEDTNDAILKASLQKQKERMIAELDMRELRQSIDWESVFDDLTKRSTSSLEKLKEKLHTALSTDDIDPENARVLAEKINEIDKTLGGRDIFASILPGVRRFKELLADSARSSEDIRTAFGEVSKLSIASSKDLLELQGNIRARTGKTVGVDKISKWTADDYVGMMNPADGTEAQRLREEFDRLIMSTIDLGKAQERLTGLQRHQKDITEELNDFKGLKGLMEKVFNFKGMGFTEIFGLVNQNVQSMSEFVDKIGVGETEFGKSVHDFADGVGGFNNAIQSLASGDVFGAVNGIMDGFAGLGNALGRPFGLGGADYTSYNDMVSRYDNLIGVWDELISRKQEYLDMSYGTEVLKTQEEINALYGKEIKAYRELGKERLNAGASTGSSSIGRRMAKGMSESDWGDIAKALGWSVKDAQEFIGTSRMTGLFDLTADQLKKIQEDAGVFWEHMDEDVRKYLESIIKSDEALQDSIEKARDRITGTSFDSVFDGFMSRLYDLADGVENVTEDAAEDWQKMMNRMVLNNLAGAKYRDQLKKWYDQWSEAYGGDNKMTSQEIEDLRREYNNLLKAAAAEVEELRRQGIVSDMDSVTPDKSASAVAADKITYDQADEGIGILRGILMSTEQIRDRMGSGGVPLSSATGTDLTSARTDVRDIADDIRDVMAKSYLELVEIRENTGAVVIPIKTMQTDIAEMKRDIHERL